MKKHIDAIASKYIITGVTSDQAILFLPAEAIFAELNAYHTDIIEYAYKKSLDNIPNNFDKHFNNNSNYYEKYGTR